MYNPNEIAGIPFVLKDFLDSDHLPRLAELGLVNHAKAAIADNLNEKKYNLHI